MKISRFAIIIVAMKSGTTSLFSLLSQHPEECPSRIKEPEFFIAKNYSDDNLGSYCSLWYFKPEYQLDISKMDRLNGSRYQLDEPVDINIFLSKDERNRMLQVLKTECELVEEKFGFDTKNGPFMTTKEVPSEEYQ